MLLLMATLCIGQSKQMKKAIRKGKDAKNLYEAKFKKPVSSDKVNSWCKENDHVLIGYIEGSVERFGDYQHGIVGAKFMTVSDYSHLVQQESKRKASRSTIKFAGCISI